MSTEFLLGVAQSAIGSGLGFALGIGAFHYQQKLQLAKQEEDDWRVALDALNRLTNAASANIEALVNSKLQLLNDLKPEIEKVKTASTKAYDAPVEEREKFIRDLIAVSESTRHFFLTCSRNSIMQPPDFSEYSSLSKDMPALTQFVHRAMGVMQEINDRLDSRNALIAGYARETGAGDGVKSARIFYYSRMLSDESDALCQQTDFALDFWRLVLDQIKAYKEAKGAGEHILEHKLIPKAAEAMPKEELFPLMREQLTTFTDQSSQLAPNADLQAS